MSNQVLAFLVLFGMVGCSTASKQPEADKPAQPAEKAAVQQLSSDSKVATKEVSKEASEAGSCVSGTDKRLLEISKTDKGGCELNYSKNGQAAKIADQISGTKHCEEVKEKIKSKLVTAGFTCS